MNPKILERICKIRRLSGNNPGEKEAESARAKYTELLERHGLAEADLDRFEGRFRPPPPPPPPPRAYGPPVGFPSGVEIHIVEGFGFGSVFGFGHSFGFGPSTGTGADTSTNFTGP